MTKIKETCCRKFEDGGRYCKGCPLVAGGQGGHGKSGDKKPKKKDRKKEGKHGSKKGRKQGRKQDRKKD